MLRRTVLRLQFSSRDTALTLPVCLPKLAIIFSRNTRSVLLVDTRSLFFPLLYVFGSGGSEGSFLPLFLMASATLFAPYVDAEPLDRNNVGPARSGIVCVLITRNVIQKRVKTTMAPAETRPKLPCPLASEKVSFAKAKIFLNFGNEKDTGNSGRAVYFQNDRLFISATLGCTGTNDPFASSFFAWMIFSLNQGRSIRDRSPQ